MNDETLLKRIALDNMILLSSNHEDYHFAINGKYMSKLSKKDYNAIFTMKELEYPVYFSFHELFNFVEFSHESHLDEYSKNDIMELMLNAIDSLVTYVDSKETEKNMHHFTRILDEISDSFFHLHTSRKNDVCLRLTEHFHKTCDSIYQGIIEGARYLYHHPRHNLADIEDIIDESSDDSDDSNDSDDSTDERDLQIYDYNGELYEINERTNKVYDNEGKEVGEFMDNKIQFYEELSVIRFAKYYYSQPPRRVRKKKDN